MRNKVLRFHRPLRFVAASIIVLPGVLSGRSVGGESECFTFEWTTSDGQRWTHEARIDRPVPEAATGFAVMLFGGGLSADLDWTTPGQIDIEGEKTQLTIDGADTRDAARLSSALTQAGFVVLRYSAIRLEDPLHAANAAMAEARPFDETISMAAEAWRALLARTAISADRVIVLGHSLGAARAVLVTDGSAAGYIFLAGAYLSPTISRPSELAAQALEAFGAAAVDGVISESEFAAHQPVLVCSDFGSIDVDRSGGLAGWELAAAMTLRGPIEPEREWLRPSSQIPWPSTVLAECEAPILAVWGGLDSMSYHGPVLGRILSDAGHGDVRSVFFAYLGHNLGVEDSGRTGPMDERIIEQVVTWLRDRFPPAED